MGSNDPHFNKYRHWDVGYLLPGHRSDSTIAYLENFNNDGEMDSIVMARVYLWS